jgi:hypothetical protein
MFEAARQEHAVQQKGKKQPVEVKRHEIVVCHFSLSPLHPVTPNPPKNEPPDINRKLINHFLKNVFYGNATPKRMG